MKVIREGREQKEWSKKFTCTGKGNGGGGCGALLLVSKSDIYKTSSFHHDGSYDHYNTFSCPCCNVETDIDENLPFCVTQTKETVLNTK